MLINHLDDAQLFKADEAIEITAPDGNKMRIAVRLDKNTGLILDCKWHATSSTPEKVKEIMENICKMSIGQEWTIVKDDLLQTI